MKIIAQIPGGNTHETVQLVNNTDLNILLVPGVFEALVAAINGAEFPEVFEDLFSLTVYTRPSGSKYGVLNYI